MENWNIRYLKFREQEYKNVGDKNQNQTQDINQLLQVRREKLANLQQAGKDPFQITKFNQTHHSMEAKKL